MGQAYPISGLPSGAAPLASPAFTGTPTAPTAAVGTDSTQIATTAFHAAAIAAEYQTLAAVGSINPWAREVVFTGTTYVATLAAIGTTTATQTPVGAQIWLKNSASGTVTVNGSGGALVVTLLTGQSAMIQAGAAAVTWLVIVTPTNMALLAGTGDLADSQLSGNVIISNLRSDINYIDLPNNGGRVTLQIPIITTTAPTAQTALIGQQGLAAGDLGIDEAGAGGQTIIYGGNGGNGSAAYAGGFGGDVIIAGGFGGISGGGGRYRGGDVFINGGQSESWLSGSVHIGGSNTDAIILADHAGCRIGSFGATPVGQQTGGAATAGVAYTATEQSMIQKVYNCLRAFGFLS